MTGDNAIFTGRAQKAARLLLVSGVKLLAKLDDLGIADNTIVMYSTDNGAEVFTWPDGASTMFAGEKATQWEGGFRVPTAIRWPGVIKPGSFSLDRVMESITDTAGDK